MHQRVLTCLAILLVVASCARTTPLEEGDVFVSELDGVEQRIVMKPDGTFVMRNPSGEKKGTYTREGQTLTIFTDSGARALCKLDDKGFIDNGGIRWTKR